MSHTLGTSSAVPFAISDLDAQEAAERQRAQVPDDFERLLEIAELDRGDVGEVVVALRRIVVQPLNDVVRRVRRSTTTVVSPQTTSTRCTAPPNCCRSASADGFCVAAAMRDVLRRRRRRGVGAERAVLRRPV